jgi:uncharacterized protein with PQ loop repeat
MVEAFVAAAATFLAGVFLIPQIARLVRSGDTAGVSTIWAAFGALTNAAWVWYLGALGLWAAAMAPALAVMTYGITVKVIARNDRQGTWLWSSGVYGAFIAGLAWLGGTDTLGSVLSVTPAIQLTPGIIAVFREVRPTGVSPTTWGLCLGEAALWGVYGWLVSDTALVGYGLFTCAGSILILGRLAATRTRLARSRPRFV